MCQINELKSSDKAVFNEVFSAYHHRIYNYILSKTQSAYLAEEVVQITFIKLWDYRNSLSDSVALSAQIFRIANTTLVDSIRYIQRKNKMVALSKEGYEGEGNQALPKLFLNETKTRLKELMASLPPTRRRVFEMSRFEEMSHKEIAQVLNIAPKTVENHINLALKYIKPFFSVLIFIGCIKLVLI